MLDDLWYSRNLTSYLLLPLSLVFGLAAAIRRWLYAIGIFRAQDFEVPVIVVGNLTVGGTGKTPLVIWLARYLVQQGYRPGIVARGYGGQATSWPQQVRADSDVASVGDEALLLSQNTGLPVCIGPDRPAAVQALLDHTDCNIVIADDGLQHYALVRDIEIVVIDGERRFGNGFLLPAGPLREPVSRLKSVDLVLANGNPGPGEFAMRVRSPEIRRMTGDQELVPLDSLECRRVHAVAGIGNPERYFGLLRQQSIAIIPHVFPDHYQFRPEDLDFGDDLPILMTEKDAVKCMRFARDGFFVVHVEAQPDAIFIHRLNVSLKAINHG